MFDTGQIRELVDAFRSNLGSLKDENTPEAVIRAEYINAFWKLLGWDGKVYVVDSGNDRMQIFASDGTYVGKWGQSGSDDGQLSCPAGICILGYDDLLVADSANDRIQQLAAMSGYFLSKVGSTGTGYSEFCTPQGICRDIQYDQAIVADTGNDRIQFFQLNSYGNGYDPEMTCVKAVSDQGLLYPMGVASGNVEGDPDQIVYVADTGNDRVLKLRLQNNQPGNSPLEVWATFKAALLADNVDAALGCFSDSAEKRYSKNLPLLRPWFDQMVEDMVPDGMILIGQDQDSARYDLLRQEDDEIYGYPVSFSKDANGAWRIRQF